jgi:hypothetical protein
MEVEVQNNRVCGEKGGVGFSTIKKKIKNNPSVGFCGTQLVWGMVLCKMWGDDFEKENLRTT